MFTLLRGLTVDHCSDSHAYTGPTAVWNNYYSLYVCVLILMNNCKSSAIAEMTAQCCSSRIFAVE